MDLQLNPAPQRDTEGRGAAVRVDGLVKEFGAHRAVDGVSFEIAAGEFLALLGPSGSGKTSILMSIAGFQTPEYGEIWVGGRRITDLAPNRRDIGVVFQNYALFPHMSVRQNIAFPLRMRGRSRADRDRLVAAALEMVRLDGHADKPPDQLSGGQQQRVAIARALVFQPRLLLMDEPLGALDRRLRQDMQFELKQLQRRLGVTILYVTHDQDEALTMASRVAVLRAGRLEQIDTPQTLYERPANAFVADFIGETNLLPVALTRSASGGAVGIGGQTMPVPQSCALPDGPTGCLAIRPERVRVTRRAVAAPGLHATVSEVVYAGGTTVIYAALATGPVLRARIVTDTAAPPLAVGDAVTLSWDAEHARIYRPDAF